MQFTIKYGMVFKSLDDWRTVVKWKVGIIVFAFGQHAEDPPVAGMSNTVLACRASNIRIGELGRGNEVILVNQWETDLKMYYPKDNANFFCVSKVKGDTRYVDTKMVFDEGVKYLKSQGVKRVIFVAHPLHLFFINLLVKTGRWSTDGLTTDGQYAKGMRHIPFDTSEGNTQWWTKGPLVFVFYLAKTFLTRKHGA